MDKPATYYETLISKYLAGETDSGEVAELKAWIASDSKNRETFTLLRQTWAFTEAYNVDSKTDLDKAWLNFADHIDSSEVAVSGKVRLLNRRSFLRVAAIILVMVIPSIIYFMLFVNQGQGVLLAENQVIESTLPDGTLVALNAGSSLHYPKKFRGNERKVSLEGEAFFNVTHNAKKAFVIEASELQIKVLGTSFYVNTNSSENTMEVVLMTGSVELTYQGKEMMLEPGDKAVVLEKFGEIVKQENKDPNLLAWKTKKLQFNNTPISDIIDILEKVYQKDIVVLNPEILNCRITATFDGQSLEAVLLVLQTTIDFNVRPNGNTIEISGEGCN